jgi:serine/threonine protein kinase
VDLVVANPSESTVDTPPMIGRCEMFDEIACGGMATIHIGRLRGAGGFGRTVAIKRMHPQFSRSPEFVAMFLDEARIVARVSHPNVVAIIDLVEEQGDLFIIMEYVEGLSFAALLRAAHAKGERAPPGVAARIVTETLQGLHAAHEATDEDGEPMCIVHRDVSPENVLVGVDGYPRVLDFGVARATSRLSATQDGHVKGKVAYMAPEQVLGMPLDRRTDVYAAAAILWQALTGRRLWKAEHIVQLAHKMLNEPIQAPSAISPDVPKKFDAIVLRGLERDISKRWKSASAMAEALEAVGGLASHREVGLWVRRLGGQQLAALTAKVAAV